MAAFERQAAVMPVGIETLQVTMVDIPAQGDPSDKVTGFIPARKEAQYRIDVVMSDGSAKVMEGDLVPHLSAAQISGLMDLMADMRSKAETEIL